MITRAATKKQKTAVKKTAKTAKKKLKKPALTAKSKLYAELATQLRALLEGEFDFIANVSNFAALLATSLPDVNWAGFYFLHGGELVLGPFQGKPACVRIPLGKGVCGVAAAQAETIIVPNVHEFPGHIVCDVASNSEIVVPLFDGEQVLGVLDLDSKLVGRFDDQDAEGLNELATIFVAHEEHLEV
ncbi:MAG TPA: GAF domain-containing protein [Pyrinomonadaceae bacterium]|jgi:L-methionine (R)-S-oxide reductase|nr:GAF domain-containing protein [Pyrinomonadaceae bacterium]